MTAPRCVQRPCRISRRSRSAGGKSPSADATTARTVTESRERCIVYRRGPQRRGLRAGHRPPARAKSFHAQFGFRPYPEREPLRAGFLGVVSYEPRAPLAAIRGSAVTLLEDTRELDATERHELHLIIVEQAGHSCARCGRTAKKATPGRCAASSSGCAACSARTRHGDWGDCATPVERAAASRRLSTPAPASSKSGRLPLGAGGYKAGLDVSDALPTG